MSVPAARLAAQAKVNLALQVGPRRGDGYHDVATILARIELADDVVVRPLRNGITISVTRDGVPDESVGPPEKNLALLAARAYMREAQWPAGCAIDIEKRIPVGAGLGGGSADAGTVLRALDTLTPRPLGADRLSQIAATLGADVPFFTLAASLALGTGRGDALEVLRPLGPQWIALVLPPFAVSTADAYAWLDDARDRNRDTARSDVDPAPLRVAARDWETLSAVATNDFQPVIAARFPVVDSHCAALRAAGARFALMSGSGSAVFGIFGDEPDVAKIARVCNAPAILARVPARVVGPLGSE